MQEQCKSFRRLHFRRMPGLHLSRRIFAYGSSSAGHFRRMLNKPSILPTQPTHSLTGKQASPRKNLFHSALRGKAVHHAGPELSLWSVFWFHQSHSWKSKKTSCSTPKACSLYCTLPLHNSALGSRGLRMVGRGASLESSPLARVSAFQNHRSCCRCSTHPKNPKHNSLGKICHCSHGPVWHLQGKFYHHLKAVFSPGANDWSVLRHSLWSTAPSPASQQTHSQLGRNPESNDVSRA